MHQCMYVRSLIKPFLNLKIEQGKEAVESGPGKYLEENADETKIPFYGCFADPQCTKYTGPPVDCCFFPKSYYRYEFGPNADKCCYW